MKQVLIIPDWVGEGIETVLVVLAVIETAEILLVVVGDLEIVAGGLDVEIEADNFDLLVPIFDATAVIEAAFESSTQ